MQDTFNRKNPAHRVLASIGLEHVCGVWVSAKPTKATIRRRARNKVAAKSRRDNRRHA